MSMQAESLEVLEKASVAPAQARAIVRAIEIEIAGAKDTLATKHDMLVLRQEFGELRQEFATLRHEFGTLRAEIGGLAKRNELIELAAQLRTEMGKLGGELHAEIHRAVSGSTRQMYLALLGQMAVMLGFFYFFLIQLR
jgi:Mg2+ and Co2+ transporter CorA